MNMNSNRCRHRKLYKLESDHFINGRTQTDEEEEEPQQIYVRKRYLLLEIQGNRRLTKKTLVRWHFKISCGRGIAC